MLRPSRRTLLRGGGALAATKLLTPAKAGFVLGKAGGGGGGGLPAPPSGFAYIINADGSYLLNADDAYILAKV